MIHAYIYICIHVYMIVYAYLHTHTQIHVETYAYKCLSQYCACVRYIAHGICDMLCAMYYVLNMK